MRRRNKSNKVPNVKLRPPQPGYSESASREPENSWWAQDSQQCNDAGDGRLDLCPRPFKSVVLCATGIVDKPTLFKQAIELGALSVPAFTDRVTHLVAESHGGAKYMCALQRKIPILVPSWITESYQIWLRGDDVDLQETMEKHRLPIFSGVILSLSGINDILRRTEINKLLTQQQGVYVKNLERPVKVTHLLCSGDEKTEKMLYAEKFNKKGEAKIHLIWEEWFWDSLEFGGRFHESKYQVQHPRPERKSIPEAPTSPPPSFEALPPELTPPAVVPAAPQSQDEPEEMATVKRLPAVTLQVWQSLLKPRGFEIACGKLVRSPSKSQESARPPQQQPSSSTRIPIGAAAGVGGGSIISSFRRANSFAQLPNGGTSSVPRQPFRRTSTIGEGVLRPPQGGDAAAGPGGAGGGSTSTAASVSCCPSLFAGLRFRVLGEARCANVRTAIEGSGGVMVSEGGVDDVDYILVRLVSGSKLFRQECDERERKKYRTECWLERCIYEERICPLDEHVSFKPLKIETPVPGAEDVHLSLSGFAESESWAIRRLVRALGINQVPNFSRRSTHLLCPSGTGAKFDKAQEWGVPVVNMAWLADIANAGLVLPASGYLVVRPRGGQCCTMPTEMGAQVTKVDLPAVDKGKGKAKDDTLTMVDITNNGEPSQSTESSIPVGSYERKKKPPEAETASYSSFGKPNGLLGTPAQPPDPSPTPPPEASSLEYLTDPNPSLPSRSAIARPSRRPTQRELERESEARVPSSKSPSPMKMPPGRQRERGVTISPAKVPNEVTRALQDSIASLLGKRRASDEEVGVAVTGRAGKRQRPPAKSKAQSRKASKEELLVSTRGVAGVTVSVPFEGYDVAADTTDGRLTEESMRVMYEDPGERHEKNRLMSLFAEVPVEAEAGVNDGSRKKTRGLVRRSGRVAGF